MISTSTFAPAFAILIFETGALAYAANMTITLLERDTGTAKMQRVAGFIQEGAQGFFRTQFFAIISMAVSKSKATQEQCSCNYHCALSSCNYRKTYFHPLISLVLASL